MVQAIATSIYCKTAKLQEGGTLKKSMPALEKMLWGGTIMLIVDHIINGELTWRFPFFTALESSGGWSVMLKEMVTVGIPMSVVITLLWAAWALIRARRKAVS